MNYEIRIECSAERDLKNLDQSLLKRMYAKIESLASDPYQRGAKKLQSFPGFRVRVGQYRILYKVDDVNRTVSIRAVRHRSEVYQ